MAKNNLGIVVGFEVRRTFIKGKFWIATLIVPCIIGLVIALVVIANTTTKSQVESQIAAEFTFAYNDDSGLLDPAIIEGFGGIEAKNQAEAIVDVKMGKTEAYFFYPADVINEPARVYGIDKGIFENNKYSAVARQIMILSVQKKIQEPKLARILAEGFSILSTNFKSGREVGGIYEIVPPLLYLVIFYIVILLMANQMTLTLLEEKENRVTEILLTTMNPSFLVIGKVLSLFIIGVVQILAFALPVVIGYVFFGDALHLPSFDVSKLVFSPGPMILGALILLGGFSLFTGTLVAVGAIMPTAREAGQVSAPMMILIFVPFYAVSLVLSDPTSFIVQVFTYFPFTAPVTALIRNGLGSLSTGAAIIVILELYSLGAILLIFAIRVFKYGSIEYSRKVPLRAIFRNYIRLQK